jgi:hypothetical protein
VGLDKILVGHGQDVHPSADIILEPLFKKKEKKKIFHVNGVTFKDHK